MLVAMDITFEKIDVDVPDYSSGMIMTDEYLGLPYYTNTWRKNINHDNPNNTNDDGPVGSGSGFVNGRLNTI